MITYYSRKYTRWVQSQTKFTSMVFPTTHSQGKPCPFPSLISTREKGTNSRIQTPWSLSHPQGVPGLAVPMDFCCRQGLVEKGRIKCSNTQQDLNLLAVLIR